MAPNLHRNLEELRQGDRPGERGFSTVRIEEFLKSKGITKDRLKDDFDADMLFEMLEAFKTSGKITAAEENYLNTMKNVAGRVGRERLHTMLTKGPLAKDSFRRHMSTNLETALLKDAALMRDFEFLHEGYVTIFSLVARHMSAGRGIDEFRESMKIETGESLEKGVAKVHEQLRSNWGQMTGKEKFVAAVGVLVFGIYISRSQNEKIKKIKDYLWTGTKLIAGIYVADVVMKALFGQRGFDMVQNWARETSTNTEWFQRLLGLQQTPDGKEKAKNAQMALVAVGDKPLEEVLTTYEASKKSKIYGVVFPDVNELTYPPDKLYAGLDALFTRFKPEDLRKRYGAEKPTLATAISNQMAEDDMVKLEPTLPQRMVSGAGEAVKWTGEKLAEAGSWMWGMSARGADAVREKFEQRWGYAAQEKQELEAILPASLLQNAEVLALDKNTVVIAGVPLACPWEQRKDGPPITYRIEGKEISHGNSRELFKIIEKKVDDLVKTKGITGYTLRWNAMKKQWILDHYPLIPAMPALGFTSPERRDIYLQIEPRIKGESVEAVLFFKPTVDVKDGGMETLDTLRETAGQDILKERIQKSIKAFNGEYIVFDAELAVMNSAGKITGTVSDVQFELVYDPATSAYDFPATFNVTEFAERLYGAKRERLEERIDAKLRELEDKIKDVPEEWLDHWMRHITPHFTHIFGGSVSERQFKLAGRDKRDEILAWYRAALEKGFTTATPPRTVASLSKFEEDYMMKFEEKADALIEQLQRHIDQNKAASHTLFESWLNDLDALMYNQAFRDEYNAFQMQLSRRYLVEEDSVTKHVLMRFREKIVPQAHDSSNLNPDGTFTRTFRNYLIYVENEILSLLENSPDVPITAQYIGQEDAKLKGIFDFNTFQTSPTFSDVPSHKARTIRYLQRELDTVFYDLERVGNEAIEDDVFAESIDEVEWRAALYFQRMAIEPKIDQDINNARTILEIDGDPKAPPPKPGQKDKKIGEKNSWLNTIQAIRVRLLHSLRSQVVRGKIDRAHFDLWRDQATDLHDLYPTLYGPEYTKHIQGFRDRLFQNHQFSFFPKEYFALGKINYQPAVAYAVLRFYVRKTQDAGCILDGIKKGDKGKAKKYLDYVAMKFEHILSDAKDKSFPGFLDKLKHLPSYLSDSTLHSEQVTQEFLKMHRGEFDTVLDYTGAWEKDIEKVEHIRQLGRKIKPLVANLDMEINAYAAKTGKGLKNPKEAELTDTQYDTLVVQPRILVRNGAMALLRTWETTKKIDGKSFSTYDDAEKEILNRYKEALEKILETAKAQIDTNREAQKKKEKGK